MTKSEAAQVSDLATCGYYSGRKERWNSGMVSSLRLISLLSVWSNGKISVRFLLFLIKVDYLSAKQTN